MMQARDSEVESAAVEFSAYSSSSTQWRVVVSAIQSMAEDATFDVDEEGIRFKGMDPSHVALTDISLPAKSFERFHCSRPTRFTVHVEDFSKLIKRSDSKEGIEISRASKSALSLKTGLGYYNREFQLHLADADLKSPPIPKLTFSSRFVMRLESFAQILNDISAISSHIHVSSTSTSLILFGKGDAGNARVEITKDNSEHLRELEVGGVGEAKVCAAIYNVEYLLKIVKAASSASGEVRFEFSNKMPMRLQFTLGEMRDKGSIHFYLAPRVTD